MRITPDTNVLVRAVVRDDLSASRAAARALRAAEVVAIPTIALCELVWVLRSVYKFSRPRIAEAIATLADSSNVYLNRGAYDAGMATMQQGCDFADGAIAYEGAWLGGDEFVSFDKNAVAVLNQLGEPSRLLD